MWEYEIILQRIFDAATDSHSWIKRGRKPPEKFAIVMFEESVKLVNIMFYRYFPDKIDLTDEQKKHELSRTIASDFIMNIIFKKKMFFEDRLQLGHYLFKFARGFMRMFRRRKIMHSYVNPESNLFNTMDTLAIFDFLPDHNAVSPEKILLQRAEMNLFLESFRERLRDILPIRKVDKVMGVIMLLFLLQLFSNQLRLRRIKNRLLGSVLEMCVGNYESEFFVILKKLR